MVKVYSSSVIGAPVECVWQFVRDFNGLPKWFPSVTDSVIEDGGSADKIGCVRSFHSVGGHRLRERLVGLSDYDRSCVYQMLDNPMAVSNHVGTIRLAPITDGDGTFIEWTAEFDCAAERETA